MEKQILKKEKHFQRLNVEMDQRNTELWKEMENVLKLQEETVGHRDSKTISPGYAASNIFESWTTNEEMSEDCKTSSIPQGPPERQTTMQMCALRTNLGSGQFSKNSVFNIEVKRTPSTLSFSNRSQLKDNLKDNLPGRGLEIGEQATIRFLKAKIKVFQEEYTCLQMKFKNQNKELHKVQNHNQRTEEERMHMQQQTRYLQEHLQKQEQAATVALQQCTNKDTEISSLRKEVEKLKKELKITIHHQKMAEIRLNRALEENQKFKTALKNDKLNEKERMDIHKRKHEEFVTTIQKLEKQKSELISAFKKQMVLIDILKRLRTQLETCKITQYTEDEFLRLLDWDPGNLMEEMQEN